MIEGTQSTDSNMDNYEVKLEVFEGPLDLLLHLIHKNEMDIFDIPIAKITDQYLEYMDMMKALNINVAGDFIVMAATLVYLKSKMLLPASKDEEDDDETLVELTQPLLEYMRFKEVAEDFSGREILDRDVFSRKLSPYLQAQIKDDDPQLDVSLFQLIDAFKRIVDQRLPGAQLEVHLEKYSVKKQTEAIMIRLRQSGSLLFTELFTEDRTISQFVATFLALLELVHQGLITISQPSPDNDIRLVASFEDNGENGDE